MSSMARSPLKSEMQRLMTCLTSRKLPPSFPANDSSLPKLEIVHTDPEAFVDIVFVHGLQGDNRDTWTTRQPEVFWPADLLPAKLKSKSIQSRIMSYGWNANVCADSRARPLDTRLQAHAGNLITRLLNVRVSEDLGLFSQVLGSVDSFKNRTRAHLHSNVQLSSLATLWVGY